MRLYFMRHGESEANLLREFSNRGLKHPLTDKGWQQVCQAAAELAPVKFKRIFSSPVLRAQQTANVIAGVVDAPVELCEPLREFDVGDFEGTRSEDNWLRFMAIWDAWEKNQEWDLAFPNGASFNSIRNNFVPIVENLIEKYRNTADNFLLVGHGGTFLCMFPLIFINTPAQFVTTKHLPNAGLVIAEPRPQGLFCLSWCGEPMPE